MNTLKRTMVALLAMLPLAAGMAYADTEHGYSRIFIFGASFMDPGNHFAVTGDTAHPPFIPPPESFASYGIGGHRPTNGHTWVEVLAREMGLTKWAKPAYRNPVFGNYAFSYARARNMDPLPDPLEPSLFDQVEDWDENGYCTGDPDNRMHDTLFIMDSGYRDALDLMYAASEEESNAILFDWVSSIAANITALYLCGAHNVLVAYLPDMAVPAVPPEGKAGATAVSAMFNYMLLQPVVDNFAGPDFNMNIRTVDFFAYTIGLKATPEAFGFTNVTDACITPYVTTGAVCKNPDAYFWWDGLHPTKKVHALLARFALGQLPVPE
jgi:outer membrane lipase/esterase